jgi:hypothetical protein
MLTTLIRPFSAEMITQNEREEGNKQQREVKSHYLAARERRQPRAATRFPIPAHPTITHMRPPIAAITVISRCAIP